MAEMELGCAVYGEGSTFSLKIARDAKVQKLQEAIYETKRFGELYKFDASALKLYLTRKGDDAWLKADDTIDDFLSGEVDTSYTKMQPLSRLSKYFGRNFEPGEEEIHILVELPTAVASSGGASAALDVNDVVAELLPKLEASVVKALAENAEKQSVYSLSRLNSELAQRIKRKMNLVVDSIDVDEPVDTSIPGFPWSADLSESKQSQRKDYMAYLRLHLTVLLRGEGFQLVDVASNKSLLDVVDPRLPFRMNGTTDVLLVKRKAKKPSEELAGIELVIKLEKNVESSHHAQAFGQLASASLKAPFTCYPMSLLTDLNGTWRFSWFNEKDVVAAFTLTQPKNAFDFIVAAVSRRDGSSAGGDGPAPIQVPFIAQPIKKLRLDDFLPMPSDAADEMMERYELMADVVEPEFLQARRAENAQHLFQSMPQYAHMYS